MGLFRKLFVALAAFAVAASGLRIDAKEYLFEWTKFQNQFGRTYSSPDECAARFEIFKANYRGIVEHNLRRENWTAGVNEFADQTWEEFRAARLGYRRAPPSVVRVAAPNVSLEVTVPAAVDWTTKGAVTPVKNQGSCGSCWAFSTTGAVEGAVAVKTGRLTSLSEQQLVDCSGAYGNLGCEGGLMDDAFKYVIANGLCTEAAYSYKGVDGACQKTCRAASKISSFVDVASNNEKALQAAVARQPVSVAIEADQPGFQFYSGGVFTDACGTNLDHGVLVVGYGTSGGIPFWKVKNSWGKSWGLDGYILLKRGTGSGKPGQCGIAMEPSYPLV
jgi:C1A family cysteine protease